MGQTTFADDRFSHLRPTLSLSYALRVTAAVILTFIAMKVGAGYICLCDAGSAMLEWFALLGVPLLCLLSMIAVRRWWLALLITGILIGVSKALVQPYLELIHGPNNPWPAPL